MGDPRVFFSSERTLLAWIRTGLTIIALGFVVARFGVEASVTNGQGAAPAMTDPLGAGLSTIVGIALVVLGSLAILVSTRQHRAFIKTLPGPDLPQNYARLPIVLLAYGTAFVGLLIAVYLCI